MKPYLAYKASNVEWLGMVPKHWEVKPTKYIFFFINRGTAPTYTEEENKTMVVNQATFSQGKWNINKIRYTTECFDSSRGALIPKDILIASTGGGVLGKVFYFEEENGKYIADSHVTILRTNPKNAHSKFYSYIFSILYDYINAVLAFGSTNQTELQRERLKSHKLPSPPLPEQQAIVDYLNRETAEMDALITEQEELVFLLKQKRSAIISEAVCRGLDPTVPMKDSGVKWLTKIPKHWQIVAVKGFSALRGGDGFPLELQGKADKDVPFHKVASLGKSERNMLEDADFTISREEVLDLKATIFPKRTIVFAKVGAALLLARFRMLKTESCIDNNMMGMIVNEMIIKPDFALYTLPICINFNILVNPGAVPSVNSGQIGVVRVPIPPIPEQQAIVDYLDRETSEIDHLIADCETSIQLLKQRRTALISEAVTGKIDVRTA